MFVISALMHLHENAILSILDHVQFHCVTFIAINRTGRDEIIFGLCLSSHRCRDVQKEKDVLFVSVHIAFVEQ